MCGGFVCSKNALAFLNILYLIIALTLIGMASYAKAAAIITSFAIAGGVIASGLFLFFVAFLGLVAGAKHHQVLLFFYIVILFLLFIIQFSVSIACLAVSKEQATIVIREGWYGVHDPQIKDDVQSNFKCCGWNSTDEDIPCKTQLCGASNFTTSEPCLTCHDVIPPAVSGVLEATGGIGLFFSFTEMLGVWLAVRYRNQKDPSANPSQFL